MRTGRKRVAPVMVGALLLLAGCGRLGYDRDGQSLDAGSSDAAMDAGADGSVDAAAADAAMMDATTTDAAMMDAATTDATTMDATTMDAATMDAATMDASASDAGADAAVPCTTWGPFGTPVRVSGLDIPIDEWAPAFTRDELTAGVVQWTTATQDDIFMATRPDTASPFGTETLVMELQSSADDKEPYFSADGLSMIFASARPGGMGGTDIWQTTRPNASSPFAAPTLVQGVNAPNNDESPWLSDDGLRIYFVSVRASSFDIYMASRPDTSSSFGTPTPLTVLNSSSIEYTVALSHDELEIFFSSDRPGGMGGEDLYMASRTSRRLPFDPPQPITELNTPYDDLCPWLSWDGTRLYANLDTATGGGRNSDVWVATRSCM